VKLKKNQFRKKINLEKKMIKIEIKNTNNFFFKVEIEKKNQFNKSLKKKSKK
jgi:hypothetical protein